MSYRLISFLAVLAALLTAAPARAGTYEHHSLSSVPDGWSPAVGAPRGFVSVGTEGRALWAGFFDRDPFDPGDVAEWSYAAPAGTAVVEWSFERAVAGIGGGDWNTLFYAVTDGRWRLAAFDVPSLNRPWGRVNATGLSASRLVARLVCAGPRSCHRAGTAAAILRLRAARVVLHDPHAPAVTAVGGDLARSAILSGTERLSLSATDRGAGVYRTVVEVDGRPLAPAIVDANGGRCRDTIAGGSPFQFSFRVPCPLAASATVAVDTTRLSEGRHTIAVHIEDAAGNRTTAYGPTTRTVANGASPAPFSPSPPAAPPAQRTVIRAWFERDRRRSRSVTARYGERVRVRGYITDAAGRALPATPIRLTEQLVDGYGRLLPRGTTAAAPPSWPAATVTARPSWPGATVAARPSWPAVTGVRVRPNGRFTAFTRVGPSRRIGFVGPDGARGPRLTLRVRAPLAVRVVRTGAAAVVRGRVRGGYVPRGTLVELQTRAGGRWATRRVVRTRRAGRFAGRLASLPPGRIVVRARVARQPRLPYAAGVSPPRTAGRTAARTSR